MCFSSVMPRITNRFKVIGLNHPPVSEMQKKYCDVYKYTDKMVKNLFE